jgi:hypothetical protein
VSHGIDQWVFHTPHDSNPACEHWALLGWRRRTSTSPPSPRGSWPRRRRCSFRRSWMVRNRALGTGECVGGGGCGWVGVGVQPRGGSRSVGPLFPCSIPPSRTARSLAVSVSCSLPTRCDAGSQATRSPLVYGGLPPSRQSSSSREERWPASSKRRLTRVNCGRADVKAVVDDAALMDAVAPKARKAYNLDQMTSIDGPDGKVRLSVFFGVAARRCPAERGCCAAVPRDRGGGGRRKRVSRPESGQSTHGGPHGKGG